MKLELRGKGVYYTSSQAAVLNAKTVKLLEDKCRQENIEMARVCLHKDHSSRLMTMLIVIINKFEYPIHRHKWKDEAYTVIKGSLVFKEFTEEGILKQEVCLRKGDTLMNNMKTYHTLVPRTNSVAFVETTTGPFDKTKTLEVLS